MKPEGPSIVVRCPAKLNLFLEVLRRRPDGYHDIDTVMQAIDLYDDLHISPSAEPGLSLECDDPSLPTDGRNLVVRAALALQDATGCRAGARLRLAKRIPAQAGLGGGSSDAAGALAGLNRLWGLGLPPEALRDVAARVGSDAAFFLSGGTARCTGRGERVEPVPLAWQPRFVLVCPPLSVATAEAYRKLRFPLTPSEARGTILLRCLAEGDVEGLGKTLYNRLEGPAFHMHPGLSEIKERLAATGLFAGTLMTGSGSALFGLCRPGQWELAAGRVGALGLGACYRVQGIGCGVEVAPG